jgi:hypothetical protein
VQAIDDNQVDDGRDYIRIGGSIEKFQYLATLGERSGRFAGYKNCKSLIALSYWRSLRGRAGEKVAL